MIIFDDNMIRFSSEQSGCGELSWVEFEITWVLGVPNTAEMDWSISHLFFFSYWIIYLILTEKYQVESK